MNEQLKKASVLTVMMLVRKFQKGGKIALQLDTPLPCPPLPPVERQEHRGGVLRLLAKTPIPAALGGGLCLFKIPLCPWLSASLDAFVHLVLLLFSLGV